MSGLKWSPVYVKLSWAASSRQQCREYAHATRQLRNNNNNVINNSKHENNGLDPHLAASLLLLVWLHQRSYAACSTLLCARGFAATRRWVVAGPKILREIQSKGFAAAKHCWVVAGPGILREIHLGSGKKHHWVVVGQGIQHVHSFGTSLK
eukprot:1153782-Pelagomonas_calceolata.AAC.8